MLQNIKPSLYFMPYFVRGRLITSKKIFFMIQNELNLIIGRPYLVKHRGGKFFVRRIYKGEEVGICNIKAFIFSAKVKKGVFVEYTEQVDKDGNKTGVCFYTWKNTQSIPRQEIAVPYYDLLQVIPA